MRRSKKGGTVYTRAAVWRGDGDTIHLTLATGKENETSKVVVRGSGKSPSVHPSLYAVLDRLLKEAPTPGQQRPREIQITFVSADGTKEPGPKFKLPDTI